MNFVKKMTILMAVLSIISLLPAGAWAGTVPYSDTTDIMDDLATLSVDGVAFNEEDYPFLAFDQSFIYDLGNGSKVLGIYEYGRGTDDHLLYIYVYHPRTQYFEHDLSSFRCDLSCWCESLSGSLYSFNDIPAVLLDHSEDYRFLKLKVELSQLTNSTGIPSSDICIYSAFVSFSGIISHPYAYDYEPWYYMSVDVDIDGSNACFFFDSSGGTHFRNTDILTLDVNHSIYYTETSPKGKSHKQALYTAYFSVPEQYFADNFDLTSLRCKWEESHTTPRVVTDDAELYKCLNQLVNYSGALDGSNASIGSVLVDAIYTNYTGLVGGIFYNLNFSCSLNAPETYNAFNSLYVSNPINTVVNYPDVSVRNWSTFNNAFLVDDLDDFYIGYDGRRFGSYEGYVLASNKSITLNGEVDEGSLKGLNTYTVSSEDLFNVTGRYSDNCFFHQFLTLFIGDDEDFSVRQLETISDPSTVAALSDSQIISTYYIGEHYVDDFKRACSNAAEAGERMVLLRYAVRDYYLAPALYVNTDGYQLDLLNSIVSSVIVLPSNCIFSVSTVFRDFTVIDLTFTGDTVSYVIDVKCEPTDVVPGVMPPTDPGGVLIDAIENIGFSIGSDVSKAWDVVLIVIKVVLAVVVSLIALKLITALVKLLRAIFHRKT